jgi:UDP-glucose 4-epimerase
VSALTDGSTPRRVVVTGGSGFIGRHVVEALRAGGDEVTVADRTEPPCAAWSDRSGPTVQHVGGDLCEPEVQDRSVPEGTDAIVHLAAETSVLGSVERPALVHRTNVDMTAGLLELARRRGVGTFVLASTNAVVGRCDTTITEGLPLAPLTPYGATKAAAEMLLWGYTGAYGLRTPCLRLTNVYGPGMTHKDSFVPRLLRAAAEGTGVQIYGDGEQRRDLVHVRDVVAAVRAALSDWPSGPVVVGSGRSHSVNEVAQAAREVTGRPIPASHVAPKPGEMPAVIVDIGRARSHGYAPTTSLEDGIRSAWDDFRPAERS